MAKKVRVAPLTTSNWVTLPGNNADFDMEADMVDDTVFGQDFKSEQPDIISWGLSSNAIYKGYSGYQTIIKKSGASTVITNEAMTLVSGKTYQITDPTKRLLNQAVTAVVKCNGVDQTANVLNIDYLFGTVTFASAFTPTTPVTYTGAYLPSSQICSMNKFSLTMQAEAVDNTDLCVAQSNGGFKQYSLGLKTVGLELSGFYKASAAFATSLKNRDKLMIEINPDGIGNSTARGFFTPKSRKQSGKAGALEDESVSFSLWVPDNALMAVPFSWYHAAGTTLNVGIQTLLSAWLGGVGCETRYLEDGTTGKQGTAVPTNVSLAGGMGALNEFSCQLKGSGAYTDV